MDPLSQTSWVAADELVRSATPVDDPTDVPAEGDPSEATAQAPDTDIPAEGDPSETTAQAPGAPNVDNEPVNVESPESPQLDLRIARGTP